MITSLRHPISPKMKYPTCGSTLVLDQKKCLFKEKKESATEKNNRKTPCAAKEIVSPT